MRILNVFNHYLAGGGEAYAVEAICDSLSHIVDLESCEFWSADWAGPAAPRQWKQALWMIRNPESLRKLRDCERRFKSDAWLLHNVFPVGSAAIYSEAKKLEIPIIQYVHNFRPFSVNGCLWAGDRLATGGLSRNYWQEIRYGAWRNSRVKTAWLAFVLSLSLALGWWRSVKTWIAISDFIRAKFISAGVPATDIFTLRHYWRPKPHSAVSYGQHYLYLGRLTHAKGISVLFDAWDILEHERGLAAPQLVVGGEGPLRSLVMSRAERMRSVTFAGELSGSAKKEALDGARAVIVPSLWWEGLGLVVHEAYDYSRPVLAARSGGLPEIVINGETGLLHEPGRAEQIAAHVLKIERDHNACLAMGAEGRRWLERNAEEAEWQRRFHQIASHSVNCS